MSRARSAAPTVLLAALIAILGCAGPRAGAVASRAPSAAARSALDALVVRNDAARAEASLGEARDGWAELVRALLARRALDGAAEVRHLGCAVERAAGEHGADELGPAVARPFQRGLGTRGVVPHD